MAHGMLPHYVISPHFAPSAHPHVFGSLNFRFTRFTPSYRQHSMLWESGTDIFAFVASLLFVPLRSVKRNSQ
ncbi:MAG: hypothetical protein LUC88_04580 [Prevotella sp.]|nr:hypothetical protein [Prevotella sp.]